VTSGRRLGIAAVSASVVGAAVAGAVVAERRVVGRARRRPDPYVDEPFGTLHGHGVDVLADDGVALRVEVDGQADGELTVVFVHGLGLSMDSFHFQRRDLADSARLVFYDQRSHGRSGRSGHDGCTIDQLGADLYAVLQAVAPKGPVVLVGHSMGGMTVLALADRHPELFGERVVGAALLSTSTGELAKSMVGLPGWTSRLIGPALPRLSRAVRSKAAMIERNRRFGSDVVFIFTKYLSFGPDAPPSLVTFMERMLLATPIEVLSEFFDTFLSHDKLSALDVLEDIPSLVCCGERDLLTPASHSELMAAALPDAELLVIPETAHMALIDCHEQVNDALRALIARVRDRVGAGAGSVSADTGPGRSDG
jgi:pimeloyl-ACP methyl ester carboxylesterase